MSGLGREGFRKGRAGAAPPEGARSPRRLCHPLCCLALLTIALAISACGGSGDGSPTPTGVPGPRAFAMGFSSLPGGPSRAGYEEVFRLAAENGEIILIQRAPPWEEFRPGGVISAGTVDLTRQEGRLAEQYGLKVFAAVDPLDPADRGRLAALPEDMTGAGFGDPRVRSAFIAYAQYLALNLRPRYMALGMEADVYEAARPDDFDNFVSLYFEAYDAVKDVSPQTLVFPTFQLEAIENLLSTTGPAARPGGPTRWHLALRFEPKVDLLAVTTYPSFVFSTPEEIPIDYYDQVRRRSKAPIAIAAMGYSSGEGRGGVNDGTEQEQEAFLRRVFADAQRLNMAFVVWFVSTDPSFVQEPPLDLLQYIGLRRADGSPKPAWDVWAEEAERPLSATQQPSR